MKWKGEKETKTKNKKNEKTWKPGENHTKTLLPVLPLEKLCLSIKNHAKPDASSAVRGSCLPPKKRKEKVGHRDT